MTAKTTLRDLIEDPVAGYWGRDQAGTAATRACRVVRNGDVAKDGRIPAEALPTRWFTAKEFANAEVRGSDCVLVSSGAYTGNVGQVAYATDELPTIVSNFVRRIRPASGVDPKWLYYLLRSVVIQRQVWPHTGGSAIPNLGSSFYRGASIEFVPSYFEQRRIAEILDTLDETTRKTEEVIAKLQQLKQGLIRDLLARGIDDNGELRDPGRHPGRFKKSPAGLIPREWDVVPVDRLLAPVNPAMRSGPFGSALLKCELVNTGVPLLGIDNVHVERFAPNYTRFVTPSKAAELSRYRVRPLDVMITIMGTVGRCCLLPNDIGHALSSKHVWTLSFDQERYSPLLACLQFNYAPWVLSHFARDEQGGIMSAIRSATLRTAPLVWPPRAEQRAIEAVFTSLQARLDRESDVLTKLRLLKHGLMDDLLTGRARVKVPAEAAL